MAKTTRKLTASQEDYLEAILALTADRQAARVRDIARRLGVAMPSVTRALKGLARRRLVHYAPYEQVTLTDRGRTLAEGVRGQHRILVRFLTEVLGLDARTANANACRMEHAVDDRVLGQLQRLEEFVSDGSPAARAMVRQMRRRPAPRTTAATRSKPKGRTRV